MSVEAAGEGRRTAETHAERSTRKRLTGRHRRNIVGQKKGEGPVGCMKRQGIQKKAVPALVMILPQPPKRVIYDLPSGAGTNPDACFVGLPGSLSTDFPAELMAGRSFQTRSVLDERNIFDRR